VACATIGGSDESAGPSSGGDSKQGLDRAALVHRSIGFDDSLELGLKIENHSGFRLYYPSRRHSLPAFSLLVDALRYRRSQLGRSERPQPILSCLLQPKRHVRPQRDEEFSSLSRGASSNPFFLVTPVKRHLALRGRIDSRAESTADDVWAVGDSGTILHWNSSAWSAVPSATTLRLFSVWGSGPNDVWAVGSVAETTIVHWNGSAWSAVRPVVPNEMLGALMAVWGSGPDDVWAVGDVGEGTALHWNGATWSVLGDRAFGYAVWGSGPNDVWTSGIGGPLHWNGTAWSLIPGSLPSGGIWGSRPGDIWAVGGRGIAHWDASTWAPVSAAAASAITADLTQIWGSGASDVWAVGYDDTIIHWNGAVWSSARSKAPGGVTDSAFGPVLFGVWGSGPDDVWAVGTGATILHR
jgi:hypothetical protein